MRINHNIASLNTYRQLSTNSANGSKSLEKLSSGLRINKAGDDAAGLAISEKMRGQIRGLDQASRNSQDAISMIQTAEGALNETHSILQRMRELAVQSSNDTNNGTDRTEIQREITQLTEEINRIGNNTEFNTKKLLNGDMTGPGAASTQESVTFNFAGIGIAHAGADTVLEIGGTTYTIAWDQATANDNTGANDVVNAGTRTVTIAAMTTDPTNIGARIAAGLTAMRGTDPTLSLTEFDFTGSALEDFTIAATATGTYAGSAGSEMIKFVSGTNPVTTQNATGSNGTNGTATIQVGANADQTFSVSVSDMRSIALGIASVTADADADGGAGSSTFTGAGNEITKDTSTGAAEYALDVSTADKATDAVTVINNAIESVSTERSKLGAYQNRLEHTIANLGTSSENLTAAESRVRDVDMAKEMMEFTKNNILSQAAQAMLAQANQQPQGVLQLLR